MPEVHIGETPVRVLTRDQIVSVLGPVDEAVIAEVVATGATLEELTEALAWTGNEEAFLGEGRPLPGGRVAELMELLSAENDEEP